jgi:VanZ family protein
MRHLIAKKISSYVLPFSLAVSIFIASGSQHLATPNIYITSSPDKLLHFLIFGLLATVILRTRKLKQLRLRDLIISIIIVSVYGVFDEIRQSFTPGRSVEIGDWIADTIGASVAVVLYGQWKGYRHLLERRVQIKATKITAS